MNQVDRLFVDSHKLMFHPKRVAQWLDGRDDWERAKSIYPLYVEISPVGACNHRCSFCGVDYIGYKPRVLDERRLSMTLREMADLGVEAVMLAGEGEPLIHKQINKIVLSAPMSVAITTNGVLLDKLEVLPICKWVKVSVNAGTEETYRKIHGAKEGDWARVWANLRDAVKRKGDCQVGAQMVLLPSNAHEVDIFKALCADAGLDYGVVKPYSQHKSSINRMDWKPVKLPESAGNVIVRERAAQTEAHPYERCEATPFMWAYIMASGDVYSCSAYLLDERFRLGNIGEHGFREIWEGERRRENWELVRKRLDIRDCRVNCRMQRVNEYLSGFDTVQNREFI